jgi:Single-strand binding protein family
VNYNKVILSGYLSQDPQIRDTGNASICSFTVVTNHNRKKGDDWIFRCVISASMHEDFRMIPHESASRSRGYEHTPSIVQHCREVRVCPPASHYANASSNALASCRSAVSKPSVNQP